MFLFLIHFSGKITAFADTHKFRTNANILIMKNCKLPYERGSLFVSARLDAVIRVPHVHDLLQHLCIVLMVLMYIQLSHVVQKLSFFFSGSLLPGGNGRRKINSQKTWVLGTDWQVYRI